MTGRRHKDLTGRRVGHLTVLRPAKRDARGPTAWLCHCDCGNEVTLSQGQLVSEHRRSCGCLQRLGGASSRAERNQAIVAAR